ncbi:MAG: helix-turn-helix transcriptional regulator [Clostridia bacterium]|nr:helix-turn-helix transcriptional regulator [Clostridia bacterium]
MPNYRNILEHKCLVYTSSRLSRFEHLHTRFEIILPHRGHIRAKLNGQTYDVGPGDMLCVFPGVLHCYETDEPLDVLMITFYEEMLPEMGVSLRNTQPSSPVADLHEDVSYCLRQLHALSYGTNAGEMLLRAYLTLLFVHLTPALALQPSDPAAARELLYRAMKYMSQHLAQPLSLKGTAQALGVNSYYLSHVFSERIHMGFRKYLNTMRVDRARRFLRLTAWPVEQVADACGFGTLRTFDRVFLAHCGCTPREYRKAVLVSPPTERHEA